MRVLPGLVQSGNSVTQEVTVGDRLEQTVDNGRAKCLLCWVLSFPVD
jgi:hypothetical protein